MRISDWSSDVCSSDLPARTFHQDVETDHVLEIWHDAAADGLHRRRLGHPRRVRMDVEVDRAGQTHRTQDIGQDVQTALPGFPVNTGERPGNLFHASTTMEGHRIWRSEERRVGRECD